MQNGSCKSTELERWIVYHYSMLVSEIIWLLFNKVIVKLTAEEREAEESRFRQTEVRYDEIVELTTSCIDWARNVQFDSTQ